MPIHTLTTKPHFGAEFFFSEVIQRHLHLIFSSQISPFPRFLSFCIWNAESDKFLWVFSLLRSQEIVLWLVRVVMRQGYGGLSNYGPFFK